MTGLRAGVVGAGVFGGYHAAKYAQDPRVEFVGVHDRHEERAAELAGSHGGRAFASLSALLDAVDAVTIAAPASTHGAIGRAALEAGKHVLVEKPIAADVSDAEAMTRLARSRGLALRTGHQERFIFAAMGLFDVAERPRRIEAVRLNTFDPRGTDVSVSLDLMTHDIDLARLLADRAEPRAVVGDAWCERSAHPDRAIAEITFANGVEARLEASRLNAERRRVMRVEYDSGVVEVDFIAKTFRNTSAHPLNADFASDPDARDPLGAGVRAFVSAALGEGAPAATGEDGLAALRIAQMVEMSAAAAA
ncbi:MAG: Gfo/Idh/MocA family oxidoreductase [Caulobacterales bacterium]|nr:Gfo/Idh/MocA family oxidoreductase [Caulobacterales bacterium]